MHQINFMQNVATGCLAAFLALAPAAARAGLIISPTGGTLDEFRTEPGQSIPTGVQGWVGGTLTATTAGAYTFTYGPSGLVAGATGHGNSTNLNEFWAGTSEAAAITAGDVFCTKPGIAACGNIMTSVGASFTLQLSPGAIPFGFHYDLGGATGGGNHTLLNSQRDDANGAYLVQIGLGTTATAGPGPVAYLGLSDNPYPADDDFQDLTVRVSTPEPTSLVVLGVALMGLGATRRRYR